jgi:V/A-type H+-transporting ATPase subunit E
MEQIMGLEAVLEEIRAKGLSEVSRIRSETQQEVTRILTAAQERAGKIKQTANADMERQAMNIQGQEVSAANLLVKREMLNTQKNLLDQVYRDTLLAIRNQPDTFHRQALARLLAEAKPQVPSGIVHANQRDQKLLESLLAEKPDLKGFSAGDPAEIDGGILVESRDGTLQLDLSYRTILDLIWESGLKDASDILFG